MMRWPRSRRHRSGNTDCWAITGAATRVDLASTLAAHLSASRPEAGHGGGGHTPRHRARKLGRAILAAADEFDRLAP
jgi:hypothetical protein